MLSSWSTARVVVAFAALSLAASAPSARSASSTPDAARCRSDHTTVLSPVFSPDSKQIAWISSCNGLKDAQIWIASADGSHAHLLGRSVPFVYQLAWVRSAGLLYTVIDKYALWHLSLDGTRSLVVAHFQPSAQQIPADAEGDQVAWPAYSCACAGPIIVKSLIKGSTRSVGVSKTFTDFDPTFSPDGLRIAFARRRCPRLEQCRATTGIWIAPITGGQSRQVATSGYSPQWSPNGRWIIYNDGHGHLVVVTPSGHRRTVLPDGGTPKMPAPIFAWSPNSEHVAVWLQGPILVFDVASGRAHAVTRAALGSPTGFAWSPDSKTLLIPMKKPSSCPSLWRVQADGSAQQMLHHC